MSLNQNSIDRFSLFVMRHKLKALLILVLSVVLFSSGAFKINTEVILQDLFPYDHPYLKMHARFSKVFGGGGFGVVMAVKAQKGDIFNKETLGKIKRMTDELVLWDEVYRVLTVSMASNSVKVVKTRAKGEIVIEALMFPDIPKTDAEMALLKQHIFSNPSYAGTLVSEDGTAALILTQLKENISYAKAFEMLHDLQQRYTDEETSVHIVGYPMLMGWIYSYKTQMYWVFAISILCMILILFFIFRNFVGMITPILMAIICTGLGLGFIGWTGINFSPLLYVLAFLVGARMLSNAVQITHRYIDEYHQAAGNGCERPRREAGYRTMRVMLMPNAAAVATDVVGFMVLGLARIVLMQQLAIIMSFWMLTIALSGIFVPVICSCLPRLAGSATEESKRLQSILLNRLAVSTADFSMCRGRYVIGLVTLGILIFGAWQTTQLKVGDPTPGSPILWPDHPYNRNQALINDKFKASSESFLLFYEGKPGSVYDPVVVKTFEAFARHMSQRLPDIYKSDSSIINLAKMINVTFHDGDPLWYQMPRNEQLLSGLLGSTRNNIDRGTLGRFMDSTLERAQITLYFSDHTSDNMLRIREAAYDFFKQTPLQTPNGSFMLAGGTIGLEMAVNEEMQQTHALMDGMVLFAIFIMCSLAFRSLTAGIMLTAPLILSNFLAFAYMALNGIGLSTNTLPCSAVGVGVGVDFAIYLYSRCCEDFGRWGDWRETICTAVRTTGQGIIFTGITLIFPILTWYFISGLKFQAQMGFFLAMLLFTNMVAAFTLHPLLIFICKPKFMQRNSMLQISTNALPNRQPQPLFPNTAELGNTTSAKTPRKEGA
ncbi:MAG: MMPL family transporter [Pseudomonadota bacterium]